MKSFSFEAIGTHWQIDVYQNVSDSVFTNVQSSIAERIELYDKTYSRFRSDSLITRIAQKPGIYTLPDDADKLFALYHQLYRDTKGLFTPLIGTTLAEAGYDASYSLQTKTLHTPAQWEDVMTYTKNKLVTTKPVTLDFGAGGKGYLIDIIGEMLEANHIKSFCIDGSGDFLYKNVTPEPLRIGLENPHNAKEAIGVVSLSKGSLCGSAGNRRSWGKFHHILNPHTLTSPKEILAVWVTAKTGLLADALSTALFFIAPEVLKQAFSFEYALITNTMQLVKSDDFPAEFFYNK